MQLHQEHAKGRAGEVSRDNHLTITLQWHEFCPSMTQLSSPTHPLQPPLGSDLQGLTSVQ